MSQEREKGRVSLLQVANGVSAVFSDLQVSLRDEGAMAERLRRFRVRRSTRDLGFRLAVVLDLLERTRTASAVTILVCGSRRLGSLSRRLAEERELLSHARKKGKEGEIDAAAGNGPGGDWCRRRRLGLSGRSGAMTGPMEARLCQRRRTKFSSTSNVTESEKASCNTSKFGVTPTNFSVKHSFPGPLHITLMCSAASHHSIGRFPEQVHKSPSITLIKSFPGQVQVYPSSLA
ncbi:hypothetical protein LR48_Vigan05g128400 [Vigna angularis]|uniref:Uncharacterized protein n=1 Tax=Phaseolus angularis TaxID=3914 RepID=A0A0L9UMA8_PHAAN|nr:hypothetical protein LR48_Vigan05g128400 [Vigna angularis]